MKRKKIQFKANPECPTCRGTGEVPGDRVPWGSTTAVLPAEECNCFMSFLTLEQVQHNQELFDSGKYEVVPADEALPHVLIKNCKEAKQFIGRRVYWDEFGMSNRTGILQEIYNRQLLVDGDWRTIGSNRCQDLRNYRRGKK